MWPTAADFGEAIQNPTVAFTDAELRNGTPSVNKLGMPFCACGQFAVVFKFNSSGNGSQAIRCFTRELGDRARRYEAIDRHLNSYSHIKGIDCLAEYEYEPNSILVRGQRYPTLQMEWIEGNSLDVYVSEILKLSNAGDRKSSLLNLANEWVNLTKALREAKLAHGDLQHGNIIVDANVRLRLVDLDGMYVPEMDGLKACELGHPNYQHPKRDYNHFGLYLDNFSSLVIYFSILALAHEPDLWDKYHDEGLILKQKDFKDTANSPLLKYVYQKDTEFKRIGRILIDSCQKSPELVPSIVDLVEATPTPKVPDWQRETPTGAKVETKTREVKPSEVKNYSNNNFTQNASGSTRSSTASPTYRQVQTSVKFNIGNVVSESFVYFISKLGYLFFAFVLGGFNPTWIVICTVGLTVLAVGHAVNQGKSKTITSAPSYLICPSCREKNNPNFSVCWKCKTSLAGSPSTTSTPRTTATSGGPTYKPVGVSYSGSYGGRPTTTGGATQSTGAYVASRVRRKYHRSNCDWALKISYRNRITFTSKVDAQSKGYIPCTACNP